MGKYVTNICGRNGIHAFTDECVAQHVLLKLASENTNPFCVAFVRDIFATLSLLVYVWLSGVPSLVVKTRDIPRMFLLGLCGVFLNQVRNGLRRWS